MKKPALILGALGSLLFLVLASFYSDFVLDDAYIIYRYAQHLAQGQGLVWNLGHQPVEGYTSFLWVLLNAFGIILSIDPVIFSKIISILSALAIIWILAGAGSKTHWSLAAVIVGAIALSPPFAFLTMQGLETVLTGLLLLGSAKLALDLLDQPSKKNIYFWYGLAWLGALARPSSLTFNGGVGLGLLLLIIVKRDYSTLRSFIKAGLVFIVLGLIYMSWRVGYFGDFWPTPYYIKLNLKRSIIKHEAMKYIFSFFIKVLFPYLIIAFPLLLRLDREYLWKTVPFFLGSLMFGLYLLTIYPLQGHLWRFIFPVFPAGLFILAYCSNHLSGGTIVFKTKWQSIILVLGFSLWALHLFPDCRRQIELRTQKDRVAAGKALYGLPGTMLVSEAGALPYYSEWKAIDTFGLTSPEIARHGITLETVQALRPDLIMLLSGKYHPDTKLEATINNYMIENNFVAVAAIYKSLNQYHYYFLNQGSPLYNEIVARLRIIPEVTYGNLQDLMTEPRIPIYLDRD